MEVVNGEFFMKGCEPDDTDRLKSPDDLIDLIRRMGFIPLFSNAVPDFSVEERTTAEQWWTGDERTDPWRWREVICSHPDIAYGKFFNRTAGFIVCS